jgi:hypothetical protein
MNGLALAAVRIYSIKCLEDTMSNEFSFVSKREKAEVVALVFATPHAVKHLNQKCHTLILTNDNGESYFIIQQVDGTYGVLKVIDPMMQLDILLQGGSLCGYGHIDRVGDFLTEQADKLILSGTPEERIEAANMLSALGHLKLNEAMSETLNLVELLVAGILIDLHRTDDTQN